MILSLVEGWRSVREFFAKITHLRDPSRPTEPGAYVTGKKGVGAAICIVARTVGAIAFIASPLMLATPFLFGTGWIAAIFGMVSIQWAATQLMDFYRYWIQAWAWVQAMWHIIRYREKGAAEVLA